MLLSKASIRWFWWAPVLLLLTFNGNALAQVDTKLAVSGRYVVKAATSAASLQSSAESPFVEKALNNGVLVVKAALNTSGPQVAAMSSGEEFVAVDSAKVAADCAEFTKEFGPLSYCEPDYKYTATVTPNDPQISQLWGMSRIGASSAWDLSTGSSRVVAVIDTGIDYTHPDLQTNVWTNSAEIPGNGRDDDGNGYIDDVHGWNAVAHNGNPFDDNGHGTHVSGTIGGVGNNGTGVAGVNWSVKIMALKFLSGSGSGSLSGAVEAINYMVTMKNRGVDIVASNNSWGGGGFSQALYDAIVRANSAGIAFVAAAGNESNDNDANPSYPASYDIPNVISVAALDSDGNMASFSNYGANTVDIAAPGVSILSTYPGNQYARLSGTSMATPHVTGALALLMGYDTSLSALQAIQRIKDSGMPLASVNGLVASGRELNIYRALANITEPVPVPTPAPANCAYTVSEISDAVDTSANGEAALFESADEYNFASLTVDDFSFDNTLINKVTISPNGLLYFGNYAPSGMDYLTKKTVPTGSVGLHSDLVSTTRAKSSAEALTVNWAGGLYGRTSLGNVDMTIRFEKSGIIKQWIGFSNSNIEAQISSNATLGFNGRGNNSATFARNSSKIHSGLALQYTPHCGDGYNAPSSVSRVRVLPIDTNQKSGRNIRSRFAIRIDVGNFSGAKSSQAQFSFGDFQCNQSATITLSETHTKLRGRVPSELARAFKVFGVSVEGVGDRRRLENPRGSSVRRRNISQEQFDSACSALANSLKPMR